MNKARLSTLCYIENDDKYLMLHRIIKANDINHNKWIGVGGHFEDRESPDDCLLDLKGNRFLAMKAYLSGCLKISY